MNDPIPTKPENRYAEARSWALDRSDALSKWARAGWIVAGIATTVAVLEAFALMSLAPLKTVVPYTLLVDRTTGYTQMLEGEHPQTTKADAALTKSLLAQYVTARESYDINSIKDQFRRVGLWSAGEARRDYLALIPASNPESPINVYPRGALVDANVSSADVASRGEARVRFIIETRDAPSAEPERTWWVAEIGYYFTKEPMSAGDRLVNPLGFAVTRYRRFQETPPPPAAETANAKSPPDRLANEPATINSGQDKVPPPLEDAP